jgi:hypothetical protein
MKPVFVIISALSITIIIYFLLSKDDKKSSSQKTISDQSARMTSSQNYKDTPTINDELEKEYKVYLNHVNKYSLNNSQKTNNKYLKPPPTTQQIYTMPKFNNNKQSLKAISSTSNLM